MIDDLPSPYGFGVTVDNVNDALPIGLQLVRDRGVERVSRGIPFIEVPGPVQTIYRTPQRRVLFDPVRDANPFFHLMESLWILSGSNRIELPSYFLSRIARFSDNGLTFHGAYGHRLRQAYGYDQLACAVRLLKESPDTRQAVLSIWHPELDLGTPTLDMPCNDMVMLSIRGGQLYMTVCNRSNDVIWGAYGANAVQFSILQEWIAAAVGVFVGYYVQQSNSYHVYPTNPYWQEFIKPGFRAPAGNPYMHGEVEVTPIALCPEEAALVLADCEELDRRATEKDAELAAPGYSSPFFDRVVTPMITAYDAYTRKDYWRALDHCRYIAAADWRYACTEWVERRRVKATVKGGVL